MRTRSPRVEAAAVVAAALLARLGMLATFPNFGGHGDPSFYASTARSIADGSWTSPFIWHWLYEPAHVVHPAFDSWAPLTAIVAVAPMAVIDDVRFAVATTTLVFYALLIVPTELLLRSYGIERHRLACYALVLTAPLLTGPSLLLDSTMPYVLLASAALALADRAAPSSTWQWAAVGGLAGLTHLTRGEGVIVIVTVGIVVLSNRRPRQIVIVLVAGFLAAVPFVVYCLAQFGRPLPPGNANVLWMRSFADLWNPDTQDGPRHLFDGGVRSALRDRLFTTIHALRSALELWMLPFIALLPLPVRPRRLDPFVVFAAASGVFYLVLLPGMAGGGSSTKSMLVLVPWVCVRFVAAAARYFPAGMRATVAVVLVVFTLNALVEWDTVRYDVIAAQARAQTIGDVLLAAASDEDLSDPVVMSRDSFEIHEATGLRIVTTPGGDIDDVARIAAKYDVDLLVLGEFFEGYSLTAADFVEDDRFQLVVEDLGYSVLRVAGDDPVSATSP